MSNIDELVNMVCYKYHKSKHITQTYMDEQEKVIHERHRFDEKFDDTKTYYLLNIINV
jgi:hypothetical protein